MFFKGLKEKSILKAITKANDSRKLLESSSKIKSLGFLVNVNDVSVTEADLQSISNSINTDLTSVLFYTTTVKKTNSEEGLTSKKDIGWKANFKSDELKAFQTKNFDVLITLSKNEELYISAINVLTKAGFKVCISENLEKYNDLSLNIDTFKKEVFISELKKYLTILNKI